MNNELGEQSIAEQRIIEDLIYEHARVARDIVQIDAQTWSIHEIEPFTDGECLVCRYCDWTNISDELGATFTSPVVPVDRLQHSVENLERIATRAVE